MRWTKAYVTLALAACSVGVGAQTADQQYGFARKLVQDGEEALLRNYEKRKKNDHGVRVKAYYNYPITKAGNVKWTPGKEPAYSIEKRGTEDVLKDAFLDLLKRK